MNVTTEQTGGVSVVRVQETRIMYPILGEFSSAVTDLLHAGHHDILVDLYQCLRGQRDDRLPDGPLPSDRRRRTAEAVRRPETGRT
jgi:hypothetical protein